MPDLGPDTPAASYGFLLQVDGGLTGALKVVEDGNGDTTGFWLSTVAARFAVPLNFQSASGETAIARENNGGTGSTALYTIYLPQLVPAAAGQVQQTVSVTSNSGVLNWAYSGQTRPTDVKTASSTPQTFTLTATDKPFQRVTSLGTANVVMPAVSAVEDNRYFRVKNVGGSNSVVVKDDLGSTMATLTSGQTVEVVVSGGAWVVF